MLLVLVILVLTAGLVWPSLDAAFAHYQLRQAAELVRANLTAARVRAIEAGIVYQFRFQSGRGDYTITPVEEKSGGGPSSADSGSTSWTVEESLPGNAFFSAASVVTAAESAGAGPVAVGDGSGSHVLLFYPDGSTDDALVVVSDAKQVSVDVSLRGLTGVVTVSEPRADASARY